MASPDVPIARTPAYRREVVTIVRLVRLAIMLVLVLLTVSFVVGIGTGTTGWLEKLVLIGLIAVCVYLAARVSAAATRLQTRLQRH
jgi:hypothetical protein